MELTRPVYCKDKHLEFLDELHESNEINMFGAIPYLQSQFEDEITADEARRILRYWMESFSEKE